MNPASNLGFAAALVFVGASLARQSQDATPPAQPTSGALAGPSVHEPSGRPATLVETDYEGYVKRLEVTPEEAAANLLDLTPEERAPIDAILTERSRMLDDFVTEHLDLLIRLGTTSQAGDKAGQLKAIVEALQAVKPIRDKGPLARQIRAVLAPDNQARFDAALKQYWDAIVLERQSAARASGKREARLAILTEERLKSFGREIERAFGRIVDPNGEREFNELLAALELRPEQESRIRRMAEDLIIRAKFKPTEAQEQAFILRVASILDQKQRRLLAERIAEQERTRTMRP